MIVPERHINLIKENGKKKRTKTILFFLTIGIQLYKNQNPAFKESTKFLPGATIPEL